MSLVLNYLRNSWRALLFVVILLLVKVFADLTLPLYMASMVNVGIQQGGMDSAVPEVLSAPLYETVIARLEAEERRVVLGAYTLDTTTYEQPTYRLTEEQPDLETIFVPALASITFGAQADTIQESMQRQAALQQIRADLESLGVDLNQMQMRFLQETGVRMIGISALGVVASIAVAFFASRIAASLGKRLRSDVFRKVVSFGQQEMDSFSTASLVTRSTNDIQQIQQSFVMILRVVIFAPLMAMGGLFRVLTTNSSMSWTIGVAILAISTVVMTMFILAMPRFRKLQILIDSVNRVVRETLTGLQVIRAFNAEAHERRRFAEANDHLTATTLFVNRAMSAMMPLMMLIMNLTTVLIVWRGAINIQVGTMQTGDMMAFIQYAMLIIMSFLMITMLTIMLPRAAVSATRIREILDTDVSIVEPENTVLLPEETAGEIVFNHVGFTYPGAETPAISDISFRAQPGKITAIIGSTGSGKSTLVNLIPRFYDVTEGSIEIDGTDIRSVALADLRKQIGYVPQQGRLFSGTVRSNIAFGNEELSIEAIEQAADTAQAKDFIDDKVDRFQSTIAQGGANVSGGQRQRLSIARALAAKPKLVLFDDSLSALDYRTEFALRSRLKHDLADSTVIIVAQRISSILHADTILVLDEGQLVGMGTHQRLMRDCTVYRQIAQSQLSPEEIAQYE
ncbi:MAG TPA: ABC transporter ATP-binding protein [Sphaerochaetaceae bacterium]|jgi:ATP-binding cassette subfamily B protein|nr:ABC transporter ATP-binding protein [Sphaerochaetaceae bacterium]